MILAGGASYIRLSVKDFPNIYPPHVEDCHQVWAGASTGSATHDNQTVSRYLGPLLRLSPPVSRLILAQVLQETVACMCTVVSSLTHDFVRIVGLLKSCNGSYFKSIRVLCYLKGFSGHLQEAVRLPANQSLPPKKLQSLTMLIFIVSLLAEHCDFDQLRSTHPGMFVPFAADMFLLFFPHF